MPDTAAAQYAPPKLPEVYFDTTHDMILMAKRNLKQDNWDYICGAAESETSLRRNRLALDCLAFRPRVCRDVSNIDKSATLFGHKLRIPVMLAPIGSIENFTEKGANDVDTAAQIFGTSNFISTVAQPGLTHALVGARDARQAQENAAAGNATLSPEELDTLNQYASSKALAAQR